MGKTYRSSPLVVSCGGLGRMGDKRRGTGGRGKRMFVFFRILKDFEWRKRGDILSLFQSSTHLISPSVRDLQENVVACRSRLLCLVSLKFQETAQIQGERKVERVFTFIHLPRTHIWYIVRLLIIYLSLYFCQCTVLLKPVYIQPHDDAWLLNL